ncbi:MAG: O-antigen ligase family protein [Candidatus Muirbacterium halophilum]|nr:O-antigen ligase family protein [Candidatus Muirbacterium halophilum]
MERKYSYYLNRVIVYFLYTLTFITPLLFSKYTKQNFLEAKEFFLLYSVSILLFLHCTYLVLSKKNTDFWSRPIVKVIILFIFSMAISFINSPNLFMSMDRFLRVIIYYIVFWVAYENFKKFENISNLLFLSILAGGMVSLYGIAQYFGIDPFFSQGTVYGNVGRLRIFSTFGNPNFLADYLVVPFPLAFMYFLEYKNKKRGIISLISFTLIFLVILFTRTRGAWVSVLTSTSVIFFFIFLYRRNIFKSILKYFLIALAATIIFFVFMFSIPKTRTKTMEMVDTTAKRFTSSTTVFQRLLMWRVTLDAFKEHPIIGNGLHSFKVFYSDYQGRFFEKYSKETGNPPYKNSLSPFAIDFRHTHNDYLQTLSEQGLFGLILFVLIFAIPFYSGIKLLKNNKNFYINLGLMASIVCVMTEAVFNFPFHRASPYLTAIFVIMALVWQERKIEKNIEEEQNIKLTIIDYIVIALAFIIMLYGLNTAYKKHMSSKLHKAGHQYIAQKIENMTQNQRLEYLERAENNLLNSISYDQSEGETFYWLGYTYFNLPGKQNLALEYFDKGLKYSNNKLLHLHSGIILLNSGKYEQAEKHFEKVKYSDPENSFTYYYMAHIYKRTKDEEKLKEALKESLILGNDKSAAVVSFYVIETLRLKDEELMKGIYDIINFSYLNTDVLKLIFHSFIEKMSFDRQKNLLVYVWKDSI